MRNLWPVLSFVLLIIVQSLCILSGQAPARPTATPLSPEMAIAITQTAASLLQVTDASGAAQVTDTPQAESVGTINLVIAQVEAGPPERLQFIDGIQDFYNGEGVRVTGGGKGKLTLKDGTELTLLNETDVSGVEVSVEPPETDIFLQDKGFVGHVESGDSTNIYLPNGAQVQILGTWFFVLYDEETQLATAGNFDGSVRYTPPGGAEVELPAGRMVQIPAQGAAALMTLPFTREEFESASDQAGTPTAGLTALLQQYQIQPIVFSGQEIARMSHPIVSAAAFSPDGMYVLSGGCEELTTSCQVGGARLWEVTTNREIRRILHGEYVYSMAFSPDGKYVVTGSCDDLSTVCSAGSARVWEIATGNEVAHVDHSNAVSEVLFSPDGNYVLSKDDSSIVRVWETFTSNEIARFDAEGRVRSVAFSPDSQYLALGTADGLAQVWDLKTNTEVASKEHGEGPVIVAFSPDGKYVASASSFSFGPGGKAPGINQLRMTSESWMHQVSFSLDDKDEVNAAQIPPGRIIVWEFNTGTELARWDSEFAVSSMAFSPSGTYLVARVNNATAETSSGSVFVWEAASGREVTHMSHDPWVNAIDISPDGNYVVSANTRGTIFLWDAFDGRQVAQMDPGSTLHEVAFSPDGKYILSVSEDDIARVWLWQTE